MPGLIIWKNQKISRMRKDMDRLFERLWDDFGMPVSPATVRELPQIDLSEREDKLIIKAEIPGMNPEDMDISLTDDVLTIKGEMKHTHTDEGEDYHRIERRYGFFSRNIQLPCKVTMDQIIATYKKGILHIEMPKCKPDAAREIKIKVK